MDAYIGQIMLFAGAYAPRDWAFCNGQILNVSQNEALYSILGNTYGGNPGSTFALPDLRSRVPVGAVMPGPGTTANGLTTYPLGQAVGAELVTLTSAQMPVHNHLVEVSNDDASSPQANGNFLAAKATFGGDAVNVYTVNGAPSVGINLNQGSVTPAGGSVPHENMQPSLAMNYIICLFGLYPTRN
jgi:microcystin-dependent protein